MKPLFLISIVFFLAFSVSAQDIDIYTKKKNSNYELPALNSQTSFTEFQLLNRTLRLQDMAYAAVVPGYVHFKVKDPVVGASMVTLRVAGYAGLYYVATDNTYNIIDLINNNQPINTNTEEFNRQQNITYISIGLIVGTYLFDWIHGKHRLEKKQERIRYKYGMKLNLGFQSNPDSPQQNIPTFGIKYSF